MTVGDVSTLGDVSTRPGAGSARTIPWFAYRDEGVFRAEAEALMPSGWHYIAHVGELREPGRFTTASIGVVPVIAVRGADAVLRGFVNVCKHRGFLVAHGRGRRETLQCDYHAWTYNLDGSLRNAPRSERERAFDCAQIRLDPVTLDTWGPFVFANPSPDPEPLLDWLDPLPKIVDEAAFAVDDLVFHRRESFTFHANWKIVAENFLECYHCPVAHPAFSAAVDVSAATYRLEVPSRDVFCQYARLRGRDGQEAKLNPWFADGAVELCHAHFAWPTTAINIFPGPPNMTIGPLHPRNARQTDRVIDYFVTSESSIPWMDEMIELDKQVIEEDRMLVEGVQVGVESGLDRGWLLPESEQLVAAFQARWREALGSKRAAALEASSPL